MQRDEAQKYIDTLKSCNGNRTRAAAALGLARATFRTRLGEAAVVLVSPNEGVAPLKKESSGMTLARLQEEFDPVTKLTLVIDAELKRGFDEDAPYMTEAGFRERCGLGSSTPAWKQASDNSKYDAYKFLIDRKVFWSSKQARNRAVQELARARAYISTQTRR